MFCWFCPRPPSSVLWCSVHNGQAQGRPLQAFSFRPLRFCSSVDLSSGILSSEPLATDHRHHQFATSSAESGLPVSLALIDRLRNTFLPSAAVVMLSLVSISTSGFSKMRFVNVLQKSWTKRFRKPIWNSIIPVTYLMPT